MLKIIQELLDKSPFSQEKLALFLDCDQSTISKWKSGERNMPAEKFEKLCHLVGYSLEDYAQGKPLFAKTIPHFRSDSLQKEDLEALAELNKMAANLAMLERLSHEIK